MSIGQTQGRSVVLRSVSKAWDGVPALEAVDIEVPPGSFTVLLGPSGCGKSTSLRIMAGLEFADQGLVTIDGKDVTTLPPSKRDIAMVFQSYALFPHLNVAENILFGLKVRRVAGGEQQRRLAVTADMLGLTPFLARKPSQLSGGQQQRVALGRAIIAERPICLMDEPLSNLDAKLRNSMRTEIRDLQQALGFSMAYVTHDQVEAITMADQVVLMRDGRVEQCGTPREIYERPATAFVAGFIGTPPMNLLPDSELLGQATRTDRTGDATTAVMSSNSERETVTVGIRPEHVRLSDGVGFRATVEHVEYLGADVLADCRIGEATLLARLTSSSELKAHDTVVLSWDAADLHFFDPTTGRRSTRTHPHVSGLLQ